LRPVAVVTVRPLGPALPLGFVAPAGATTLLPGLPLGWLPAAGEPEVGLLLLLAFVVPLQLPAAVFAHLSRDTAVGTGMGILTGTRGATGWCSWAPSGGNARRPGSCSR
jgi:hypothetical protein